MENLNFKRFESVVNQLKLLIHSRTVRGKSELFIQLISSFKELSTQARFSKEDLRNSFYDTLNSFFSLREHVYFHRRDETLLKINDNPGRLRLSCFELMEHDFRENTHSNIHKYLFDYHFVGHHGPELLWNFLGENTSTIPGLRSKLFSEKYLLLREHTTGSGRIDLMILDDVNKFVIVIENKVLADVSVREPSELELKRTQLNDYIDYVEKHYQHYDRQFILLTFLATSENYPPYQHRTYKELFDFLEHIDSEDAILIEYKLLLHSLLHGISDKAKRSKDATVLSRGTSNVLHLNNLELLNLIYL